MHQYQGCLIALGFQPPMAKVIEDHHHGPMLGEAVEVNADLSASPRKPKSTQCMNPSIKCSKDSSKQFEPPDDLFPGTPHPSQATHTITLRASPMAGAYDVRSSEHTPIRKMAETPKMLPILSLTQHQNVHTSDR
eukprot:scaffold58972_cov64-Attheya_sp.AAC.1